MMGKPEVEWATGGNGGLALIERIGDLASIQFHQSCEVRTSRLSELIMILLRPSVSVHQCTE